MRIKNLRGGGSVRSDLKKLDSFTLEMSKNHLISNFLRNGRLRVNVLPSLVYTGNKETKSGNMYPDSVSVNVRI